VWEVTPTPTKLKMEKEKNLRKKFLGGCGKSPHPEKGKI
jgi:hypothetical protein